jgi:Protein of unknown function (DUF2891)
MIRHSLAVLLLLSAAAAQNQPSRAPTATHSFDAAAAQRFAGLALACVHKEYPNKISHSLTSDADVAPPRKLTPAFYGCYDWHSSVHGHWLLVRLLRTYPDAPFAAAARTALEQSLTSANVAQEAAYLNAEGRASFERPYGLAWLLQLGQELGEWEASAIVNASKGAAADPLPAQLAANLRPLEQAAAGRLKSWLPKLSFPVRSGEHSQTAFALGLMIDYARATDDRAFSDLLLRKTRDYYQKDENCPLAYEPSGEDFLSPCLAEADVVRRVLAPEEFAAWLRGFMPQIPTDDAAWWLQPAVVTDPADPRLAHLDGLNLSRAWMLEGIASSLPAGDPRLPALRATAKAHREAGLASVTGAHYEGGHWLGSFAVYLTTHRGLHP